jgi:hypothetical protein
MSILKDFLLQKCTIFSRSRSAFCSSPIPALPPVKAGAADCLQWHFPAAWSTQNSQLQLLDVHGNPVSVSLKQPELVGPLTQKQENVSFHIVKSQPVAHKPGQGVDPKSHVGRFAVNKISGRTRQGQHQNSKVLIRPVSKAPNNSTLIPLE